jgi:hypothetical protein
MKKLLARNEWKTNFSGTNWDIRTAEPVDRFGKEIKTFGQQSIEKVFVP